MHLIKIFLLIVFNLIIIVFMTQNSNEKVDIFFLNYSLNGAYLNVVLLFNLLFGVAAGFLASVFTIISNKFRLLKKHSDYPWTLQTCSRRRFVKLQFQRNV